mgnify:CR=1 FL=1
MSAGAYYVYILASRHHGTLYVGICNDLANRITLHRSGRGSQFVKKYDVTRLVYVETYASPQEAIAREKQLIGKFVSSKKTIANGLIYRTWSKSCGCGSGPSPGRRRR